MWKLLQACYSINWFVQPVHIDFWNHFVLKHYPTATLHNSKMRRMKLSTKDHYQLNIYTHLILVGNSSGVYNQTMANVVDTNKFPIMAIITIG